ncbi:MAG: hypothetical protein JW850_01475 [Thermoflexales bacterium]|nr:hypothetical protein [Thermoflexales bacterium]
MSDSARSLFRKILKDKPSQAVPPGPDCPSSASTPGGTQPGALEQASTSPLGPTSDGALPSLTERLKPRHEPAGAAAESARVVPAAAEPLPSPSTYEDARLVLHQIRGKMAHLAEEFAEGRLNSQQFHEIYAHYQEQRRIIEAALENMPDSEAWRKVITPGVTAMLRERNVAKVLSYAIYDNNTSLPLASVGDFAVDTALLVPMLSSFRSATAEMFGAGLRSTEIEGGRWLCFVPGSYTTLFAIFSLQPARLQLTLIEDLHRDFEVANRAALESEQGTQAAEQFAGLWVLDRA